MQHRRQSNRKSKLIERLESRRMWAAHIVGNSTVYATIQAAVDAASSGATINVDPGTYSEQVYIGKKLTLRGAQAGVDARSNVRLGANETIVNGITLADLSRSSSFYIAANDVTLDGFTVQGETQLGDTGAGIVIAPGKAGTHIVNSIVQNNVAGLFLANSSNTNPAVIQFNLFRGNNNDGSNGGRAIYSNGGISGGKLTNVLIDSNAFINNYGGLNTTRVEGAISLESRTLNSQSNITITNNSFDGNGKSVLVYNADHIDIQNNFTTYNRDQWSAAFRFEGGASYVNIKRNTVYDNPGPAVRIDEKGFSGSNNNFVITDNNFTNCSTAYTNKQALIISALNQYDGTLIATNNWWGDPSGPSGDAAGTGQAIILFGNAGVYSPWATSLIGTGRMPYYGLPQSTNAPIQLEDFDHGGEGIAYHDNDSSNSGGQYRKGSNRVDIGTCNDVGGGYMLSYVRAGEWIKYQIDAAQSGVYNLDFRIAAAASGGKFHLMIDGVDATGVLTIPSTGSFSTWGTMTKTGVTLSKGLHDVQFVVDANNSAAGTANFNWMKFTLATASAIPASPSMLTSAASGFAAVQLAWLDNSDNESGFILERRTMPYGAWQQIATTGANVSSVTDTTVVGGTTYSYRVRAINSSGESGNSADSTITTPMQQEITYLSDLPFAGAVINGWGPIERDMSVGGEAEGDGGIITLNGVTYAKGLGAHAVSDVSFALGGAYGTFASDIGIDDRQLFAGSAVFQVFADGAKIYDSGIMGPDSVTKTLTLNVAGVQTLRLHVDDGGDGIDHDHADWAGARLLLTSAPPPPTVPAAPAGLTATAISPSQINLAWGDVANETSYKIQRSLDGVTYTQIGATGAGVTSYSDSTGLVAGTKYYYRVIANNSAGDSGFSNVASTTTFVPPPAPTVPAAPTGLAASAASVSQITLTWSNVANETSYKIQRSLDGVNFTQIGTTVADVTTYNDSGLSAGTKYYYRVIATNSVGDSGFSNVTNATTFVAPPPTTSLPTGWTDGDIGVTGSAGSATYSNGSYTLNGAGAGLGGTSDALNFASTTNYGNGTLTARVASTNGTAGIMLREGSAASARFVGLVVNPNGSVSFLRRTSVGGATATTTTGAFTGAIWLRLVRSRNNFTAYVSTNGSTWSTVGSASVNMTKTVSAGMIVFSKTTSLASAVFDNVSVR